MAWVPSHQELRDHPKTRRAARSAGVSIPTLVGHLHLLWHWALDHAPDGDLGRFDAEDLADGAMWQGDPERLVKALLDCGPGGSAGFLEPDWKLHDWDEFGGRYGRRVNAAKKAANARWALKSDPQECVGIADALQGQCDGDAEERRGEEKTTTSAKSDGAERRVFDAWISSTGKTPGRVKFTADRQRLIKARLRDYSEADLLAAVDGWRFSPYHRGENQAGTIYNDLGLLLRNGSNVERFRDMPRGSVSDDLGPNESYR